MCNFLYDWSFLKLIFRLYAFSRKISNCSIQLFCVFVAFEYSEVFTAMFKICFASAIFQLSSSVLFLTVSMSSWFLEHWFSSISMSLTSKLLHPGASLWFVNFNPLASQLNFAPFIWNILFKIWNSFFKYFFAMIFSVDKGSAWGVEVYDIIFWRYILLDFELITKIFVNFPFYKNCKILVFKIIPCEFVPPIHIFLFNLKRYRF